MNAEKMRYTSVTILSSSTRNRWRGVIRSVGSVALAGMLAVPLTLHAQPYPYKPIRFVVGFQPGGAVDISARTVGMPLSAALGQSVVVDNKAGAAGNIAADFVAKATPDGYTLLMCNSTIAFPALFRNLPFDVRKDLEPVSLIAIGPSVLLVHPSVQATNLKELIALARAKPKQLTYGSGGIGNITHLEMELMNSLVGVQMVHVPYKGAAPSLVALMGGEVQMVFASVPISVPQIKAGKVRTIAVSTIKRNNALPDVPTISEAGVPGFDAASWYGVFAPAGTPKAVSARLSTELVRIMKQPEMRDRFAGDGFEPTGSSASEFAAFLKQELAKWDKAIKMSGIKPE
jgi:tripartite-type tricarboxylate transporter receptor subunit TctC